MTATAAGSDATTAADIRERVREAVARRQPVRIIGGGTWLDANRPVHADVRLSTVALTGIVEYVPGDLTLTARAGTTLDEIARATAAHDQWLALDPFGDPRRATIGATIATSSYGPLAHHFGTPRDMALGLEFVAGTGDIVRGGGRVVKNVAGFDLTRLLTGSWGSLGIITEVSVRLRARPATQRTFVGPVNTEPTALDTLWRRLRELPFVPFAAQVLDRAMARALHLGDDGAVFLVRIGGNEDATRAQGKQLRVLGELRESDESIWEALRVVEPRSAIVMRLSRPPSRFAETWNAMARVIARWPTALCHGDLGRGVVRCIVPYTSAETIDSSPQELGSLAGTRVFERLPDRLWAPCAPSRMAERLPLGIKRAFDPHRVLNPGILGDVA